MIPNRHGAWMEQKPRFSFPFLLCHHPSLRGASSIFSRARFDAETDKGPNRPEPLPRILLEKDLLVFLLRIHSPGVFLFFVLCPPGGLYCIPGLELLGARYFRYLISRGVIMRCETTVLAVIAPVLSSAC